MTGSVIYAFPNTNLLLPCFPSEDIHISGHSDNTNYTWTHGNNKIITEGRIVTDVTNRGHLTVHELSINDSDNYTCWVKYENPDTGHYTDQQFVHTVIVVSLPVIVLHVVIHYKAKLKCDEAILEMFELYFPQQLEQALCSISNGSSVCDINIYHTVCHTHSVQARNERDVNYYGSGRVISYWRRIKRQAAKDSMEMSLNFEVRMHEMANLQNISHCNPLCQKKVILKLMQLINDSFPDILSVKVTTNLGATFQPVTQSLLMRYVVGCQSGYELTDGFCTPCKKDYFSGDGATSCSACPRGTYQNHVGARSCIQCTNHWIPACNEFTEEYNMEILVIVFAVIVFLLVGFGVIYVFFIRVKETHAYETLLPVFAQQPKKQRGKLAKSARYQKKRVQMQTPEESEPLLDDDSDQPYEIYYKSNHFIE